MDSSARCLRCRNCSHFSRRLCFFFQSVDLIVQSQRRNCPHLRVCEKHAVLRLQDSGGVWPFSASSGRHQGPLLTGKFQTTVFHCSHGTLGSPGWGKKGFGGDNDSVGNSSAILVASCHVCKEDSYLNLFYFLLFSSTLLNCIN